MQAPLHYLIPLVAAAGAAVALLAAPTAAGEPKCTNTTPTTTQCERAGNSQIVTGPGTSADTAAFPFPEWPWGLGGITIGIGG
jgi:hypothetical protein